MRGFQGSDRWRSWHLLHSSISGLATGGIFQLPIMGLSVRFPGVWPLEASSTTATPLCATGNRTSTACTSTCSSSDPLASPMLPILACSHLSFNLWILGEVTSRSSGGGLDRASATCHCPGGLEAFSASTPSAATNSLAICEAFAYSHPPLFCLLHLSHPSLCSASLYVSVALVLGRRVWAGDRCLYIPCI